jgi:DNA-binding MarR family transcriptional regulator
MPSPRKAPRSDDQTPSGRMAEAGLKHVIGYQLAQASVSTMAVFDAEVGTPQALRPVEYTVLQLIAENPGSSPVKLAKALAVTKPNITMWVDRLVSRGLVERSPSATDKRAQELRTTAAGARLAASATARLLAGEQRALSLLSDAERAILAELLHKVASCLPR